MISKQFQYHYDIVDVVGIVITFGLYMYEMIILYFISEIMFVKLRKIKTPVMDLKSVLKYISYFSYAIGISSIKHLVLTLYMYLDTYGVLDCVYSKYNKVTIPIIFTVFTMIIKIEHL